MAKQNKRNFKEHVKHKSKLSLLVLIKIVLALICFYVATKIFSYTQGSLGTLLAGLIAILVSILLYLIIIIKIVKLLKFK